MNANSPNVAPDSVEAEEKAGNPLLSILLYGLMIAGFVIVPKVVMQRSLANSVKQHIENKIIEGRKQQRDQVFVPDARSAVNF